MRIFIRLILLSLSVCIGFASLNLDQKEALPEDGTCAPHLARAIQNANELVARGDYQDARRLLLEISAESERNGEISLCHATVLNNLGSVCQDLGEYSEARKQYRRAIWIYRNLEVGDSVLIAGPLNNLGMLFVSTGEFSKAEPMLQRSVELYRSEFGASDCRVAITLKNLANLHRYAGKLRRAEAEYREVLQILSEAPGNNRDRIAVTQHNLGLVYSQMGRSCDALPLLAGSLADWERAIGADHPDVARGLTGVAAAYLEMGMYAEAENHLNRAFPIIRARFPEGHPLMWLALSQYAELLSKTGRGAEAKSVRRQAKEMAGRHAADNRMDSTLDLADYVSARRNGQE